MKISSRKGKIPYQRVASTKEACIRPKASMRSSQHFSRIRSHKRFGPINIFLSKEEVASEAQMLKASALNGTEYRKMLFFEFVYF